jgi:predicted nucleic acid-binding protein
VTPDDVPDGPLCVDTDVFSLVFTRKGRYGDFLPLIEGRVLAVSFAVVAELRAGAIKAGWGPRRRERQERILRQHYVVLTPTDRVVTRFAERYAVLGEDRLKRGGVNDQWTASCALVQDPPMPIVTGNLRDFEKVAETAPALTLVHPDLAI